MLEKLKGVVSSFLSSAKEKINTMQKPIKFVIVGYFILVVMLVLTYYAAWLYLWQGGKATLPDLLAIIQEMIGTAMISFVSFIGGCFVDMNGNGIPDKFEDKKEGQS